MDIKNIKDWNDKNTDTSGLKDGQVALGYYRELKKEIDGGFIVLHWNTKYKNWVYYLRHPFVDRHIESIGGKPDFWIKLDPPEENKNG